MAESSLFPQINIQSPSEFISATPSRPSTRFRPSRYSESQSEDLPSISSFIDGLSPHPSVHTHPFLSASPPPLISGLQRHPDAPKPFSLFEALDLEEDVVDEAFVLEDDLEEGVYGYTDEDEAYGGMDLDSVPISNMRTRSSRSCRSAIVPPDQLSRRPLPTLSRSASVLSSSSSSSSGSSGSTLSVDLLPTEESQFVSPFDDPKLDTAIIVSTASGDDLGGSSFLEPFSPIAESPLDGYYPFSSSLSCSAVTEDWTSRNKFNLEMRSPSSPRAISMLLTNYMRR